MSHPHIQGYRPDIDGLRAFAVLAVVTFHAFPATVRGGFLGVDVFFAISGYLICGILLRELEAGSFSFRQFYSRRVRRIFPALLLVLAALLPLGWHMLLPDEYAALGKHILGGATFSSNLLLWSEAGYFDAAAKAKPLLHLWSLGIEEQFYIFFPLLLWACAKRHFRLITIILFLMLLSFLDNIYPHHRSHGGFLFTSGQGMGVAGRGGPVRGSAPGIHATRSSAGGQTLRQPAL